ncbi:hypothetical protein [Nannocystis pusilla]|uniref:hypothetical protein n=1 Tax=Nannocystis pusilla TaxID=889268 RepID=UPI003B8042A4
MTRGMCKYNRKCADSREPLVECEQLAYEDAGSPEDFAATCSDYDRASARACLRYVRSGPRMCGGLSERPTECEGVRARLRDRVLSRGLGLVDGGDGRSGPAPAGADRGVSCPEGHVPKRR